MSAPRSPGSEDVTEPTIGDCIIAGIGADDNAIGQMAAILGNLKRAGYAIVKINHSVRPAFTFEDDR